MSNKSSTATVKAWNWVIQSLASFKKLDAFTLSGLVKKDPAISNDLEKDAREMVSLRILETLFIQENEAIIDSDSAQNSKISFDLSEHSEDVLHKILKETSKPMTELERQKWNVRPFILHKWASFSKSPLQKFKEALLVSRHPILESLKEMSNLQGVNVSENTNTIPEFDVDLNASNENKKLQESQLPKCDHIGRNEHEMSIEPPLKGLEENTLMENVSQMELGTDSDKSDNERTDLAAKKEAFLSSQGTLSQDFLATIDCTEICLCMKCNKDGELLVCSSDTCPIRVHESCLASAANFDKNGNYFCPFCAYSREISKYLEVKKKTSLARKDLQAFLSSKVIHRPIVSSREIGAAGENFEVNIVSLHLPVLKRSRPKQKYVSSVSGYSKRPRKHEHQYTSPTVPLPRRKIILWTKLEEETLKEGVQRFPSVNNKGIPWTLILDFGRDIFDKSRTTVDLKDKWRNICKGIPEEETKL